MPGAPDFMSRGSFASTAAPLSPNITAVLSPNNESTATLQFSSPPNLNLHGIRSAGSGGGGDLHTPDDASTHPLGGIDHVVSMSVDIDATGPSSTALLASAAGNSEQQSGEHQRELSKKRHSSFMNPQELAAQQRAALGLPDPFSGMDAFTFGDSPMVPVSAGGVLNATAERKKSSLVNVDLSPDVREADLMASAASVFLPFVDRYAADLRWRGGVSQVTFIDNQATFMSSILMGQVDAVFECDDPIDILRSVAIARAETLARQGIDIFEVDPSTTGAAINAGMSKAPVAGRRAQSNANGSSGSRTSTPLKGAGKAPKWHQAVFAVTHASVLLARLYECAREHCSLTTVGLPSSLSWEQWLGYLIDCGINCSEALTKKDGLFYTLERKQPFSATCTFASSTPDNKLIILERPNSQVAPEAIIVTAATADVHIRSRWPMPAQSGAHVPANGVYCCATEMAIFFMEAKHYRTCVSRILTDALAQASPSVVFYDSVSQRLFAGSRAGHVWLITPPKWRPKHALWDSAAVASTIMTNGEPIAQIRTGAAPNLLFALTTKGSLHTISMTAGKLVVTTSTTAYNMALAAGVAYSAESDLLVCGGEAPFLLAWPSRTTPGQPPMVFEDTTAPHAHRVVAVVADPDSSLVASIDSHGMLKLWDSLSLQCTQTFSTGMEEGTFTALLWLPRRIVAVSRNEYMSYRVDDDNVNSTVTSLVGHPSGTAIAGCVGSEVIEWNCHNGRKVAHRQKICTENIQQLLYDEQAQRYFVLTAGGDVCVFAASTNKLLNCWNRKTLAGEPNSIQWCPHTQRIIIATAERTVWFVDVSPDGGGITSPLSRKVNVPKDASCCQIAVGKLDRVPVAYFLGTTNAYLHVATPKAGFEGNIAVHHSLRLPFESVYCEDDALPAVSMILFSESSVIVADTAGGIHVVNTRGFELVTTMNLNRPPLGVKHGSMRRSFSLSGNQQLEAVRQHMAQQQQEKKKEMEHERKLQRLREQKQPWHIDDPSSSPKDLDGVGNGCGRFQASGRLSNSGSTDGSPKWRRKSEATIAAMNSAGPDAGPDAILLAKLHQQPHTDESGLGGHMKPIETARTHANSVRAVTCGSAFVAGVFIVVGDCLGGVALIKIDPKRELHLLSRWEAFPEAVTGVCIENDIVFAAGMSPSLAAWNLSGDHLGDLWGPCQEVKPLRPMKPPWLELFDQQEAVLATFHADQQASACGGDVGRFGRSLSMSVKRKLRGSTTGHARRLNEGPELSSKERALFDGIRAEDSPPHTPNRTGGSVVDHGSRAGHGSPRTPKSPGSPMLSPEGKATRARQSKVGFTDGEGPGSPPISGSPRPKQSFVVTPFGDAAPYSTKSGSSGGGSGKNTASDSSPLTIGLSGALQDGTDASSPGTSARHSPAHSTPQQAPSGSGRLAEHRGTSAPGDRKTLGPNGTRQLYMDSPDQMPPSISIDVETEPTSSTGISPSAMLPAPSALPADGKAVRVAGLVAAKREKAMRKAQEATVGVSTVRQQLRAGLLSGDIGVGGASLTPSAVSPAATPTAFGGRGLVTDSPHTTPDRSHGAKAIPQPSVSGIGMGGALSEPIGRSPHHATALGSSVTLLQSAGGGGTRSPGHDGPLAGSYSFAGSASASGHSGGKVTDHAGMSLLGGAHDALGGVVGGSHRTPRSHRSSLAGSMSTLPLLPAEWRLSKHTQEDQDDKHHQERSPRLAHHPIKRELEVRGDMLGLAPAKRSGGAGADDDFSLSVTMSTDSRTPSGMQQALRALKSSSRLTGGVGSSIFLHHGAFDDTASGHSPAASGLARSKFNVPMRATSSRPHARTPQPGELAAAASGDKGRGLDDSNSEASPLQRSTHSQHSLLQSKTHSFRSRSVSVSLPDGGGGTLGVVPSQEEPGASFSNARNLPRRSRKASVSML